MIDCLGTSCYNRQHIKAVVKESPFNDNFKAEAEERPFRNITIGSRTKAMGFCSDGRLVFISESVRASEKLKSGSRARVNGRGVAKKTLPESWTTGESNLELLHC